MLSRVKRVLEAITAVKLSKPIHQTLVIENEVCVCRSKRRMKSFADFGKAKFSKFQNVIQNAEQKQRVATSVAIWVYVYAINCYIIFCSIVESVFSHYL